MSTKVIKYQSCEERLAASPDREVTHEVVFGTVEFRSNSLAALAAELMAAVESGAFDDMEGSFVLRVRGGELSPAHHQWYSSKP